MKLWEMASHKIQTYQNKAKNLYANSLKQHYSD